MTLFALARAHHRITRRSKALWLTVIPLTAFAALIAVISPAAPHDGGTDELVFAGQIIAMFTGVAFAAAFSDFATTPRRLGVEDLEATTPVHPLVLHGARMFGAFSVVIVPSLFALLTFAAFQTARGDPCALAEAAAVTATINAPSALLAMAVSACAGALLRGFGRIAAVLVWFWLVFSTPLIPLPTLNGTALSAVGDPVAAGYFGAAPIYEPVGSLVAAPNAWIGTLSLIWQLILILALLTAGTLLARTRRH